MNLHGIVAASISAVNPLVPVTVQVSTGPGATTAAGKRVPTFATPGGLTGSITGDVLTVTAQASGKLLKGQTLTGTGIPAQTSIVAQLSGTAGGLGTYRINRVLDAPLVDVAITTALIVPAQIQSLTFRDLQQIDGLNLQGNRNGIYFYGQIDGIVRPDNKGGDLITFPDGSIWLVAMVLEDWPDWCKVAATRQNP
jgi:hypothetical protein